MTRNPPCTKSPSGRHGWRDRPGTLGVCLFCGDELLVWSEPDRSTELARQEHIAQLQESKRLNEGRT